jgi:hypothetical protein
VVTINFFNMLASLLFKNRNSLRAAYTRDARTQSKRPEAERVPMELRLRRGITGAMQVVSERRAGPQNDVACGQENLLSLRELAKGRVRGRSTLP